MIKLGYKAKLFDPKKNSFSKIDKKKVDVIFNALHGEEGGRARAKFF